VSVGFQPRPFYKNGCTNFEFLLGNTPHILLYKPLSTTSGKRFERQSGFRIWQGIVSLIKCRATLKFETRRAAWVVRLCQSSASPLMLGWEYHKIDQASASSEQDLHIEKIENIKT
jgi:hypothetical protein